MLYSYFYLCLAFRTRVVGYWCAVVGTVKHCCMLKGMAKKIQLFQVISARSFSNGRAQSTERSGCVCTQCKTHVNSFSFYTHAAEARTSLCTKTQTQTHSNVKFEHTEFNDIVHLPIMFVFYNPGLRCHREMWKPESDLNWTETKTYIPINISF